MEVQVDSPSALGHRFNRYLANHKAEFEAYKKATRDEKDFRQFAKHMCF